MGLLLLGITVYSAAGFVFAMAFVVRGVERVDPAARGAGWGFRVMIVPGVAALWPWMLMKWARAMRSARPVDEGAHT